MDDHRILGYSRKGREDLHETADRWLRARRALPAADQPHAERLAEMIRAHATDRLVVIGDPLEAAMFSLLIEMVKEQTAGERPRSAGDTLQVEHSRSLPITGSEPGFGRFLRL